MSVQLIIFPQSFDGLNPLNSQLSEFVVDGVNFLTINAAPIVSSSNPNIVVGALTSQPPNIPNQWYKFRSGTAVDAPERVSNKLKLYRVATLKSGVYQKLSNLAVGQDYEININVDTGDNTGFLVVQMFDGTTTLSMSPTNFFGASAGLKTTTFTANNTDNVLTILFVGFSGTKNILIEDISVQPVVNQNADIDLANGQVILDLYEDEDIPLTLSVDDFKNVAEKVQSYSKAFNLPATKRNNQAFDNIFDITRTDTGIVFNPYIKTKCELKQDGFILFEGYLRLIDISNKDGETSYNVNLYSEAIALADFLKEKTFRDIDFTELEHQYTKTNIKLSWNDSGTGITYTNSNTSGFRDANDTVKYPFVDWTHQFIQDANNNPELTTLGTAFRPWLQLKYLIQRIFNDSPFTFTSAFFDTTDFKRLYMDFNWGGAPEPHTNQGTGEGTNQSTTGNAAGTTYTRLIFDEQTFSDEDLIGFEPATSKFVAQFDNQRFEVDFNFAVNYTGYSTPSAATTIGQLAFNEYDSSNVFVNSHSLTNLNTFGTGATTASITVAGTFTVVLPSGNYLIPQFKRTTTVTTLTQLSNTETLAQIGYEIPETIVQVGNTSITNDTFAENLRGNIKQYDFLKGIMTMFNLIAIPDKDNPNNIQIEPYGDIFINNTNSGSTSNLTLAARSIQHDWTEKIDVSEIKLTPLTDLNKITKFGFVVDDDDFVFNKYKRATSGHEYGSKIFDASGFTILEGTKDIIAEPFAATVLKQVMPEFTDFITPAIYAYNASDGTSSGFDNSPRICYNVGLKTLTSCTYKIPAQNGVSGNAQEDDFLQFGHLSDISTVVSTPPQATDTLDFNFGECQFFNGIGSTPIKNLFNIYWLPYYNELYNSDTRVMTIKVNLNAGDIATFNLFDTVFIKNREYRVNRIDYKPNDLATVEFILIP